MNELAHHQIAEEEADLPLDNALKHGARGELSQMIPPHALNCMGEIREP